MTASTVALFDPWSNINTTCWLSWIDPLWCYSPAGCLNSFNFVVSKRAVYLTHLHVRHYIAFNSFHNSFLIFFELHRATCTLSDGNYMTVFPFAYWTEILLIFLVESTFKNNTFGCHFGQSDILVFFEIIAFAVAPENMMLTEALNLAVMNHKIQSAPNSDVVEQFLSLLQYIIYPGIQLT